LTKYLDRKIHAHPTEFRHNCTNL